MSMLFADTLKRLRTEKGLSQRELSERIFVTRTAITKWESGDRLPDAVMVSRLAEILGVDVNTLLSAAAESDDSPNVIIVDDNKAILADSLSVLEEIIPNATITGFIWPNEAIEFAKVNRVSLAILDIELGSASGLDLCHTLQKINPRANVIYLTAYPDYSLDAWKTEACGFMVKPLTADEVRAQLNKLRYPLTAGGATK